MRRKCYAFCMIVIICLVLTVQPAFASSTPQVSASASGASVGKGETVKVTISLKNNPKISTFGVTLNYHPDEFQYKDCKWSSALGGNDMKMVSDEEGNVNVSLVCDQSYEAEGTVATIVFQAKKDVAAVNMTLQLREMADENLSDVENCKLVKTVQIPKTEEKATVTKQDNNKEAEQETKKEETSKKAEVQKQEEVTKGVEASKKVENQVVQTKIASSTGTVKKPAGESESVNKIETKAVTTSSKLDENYKTGVAVGADILFVIAAICGLGAFIFWNEQKKER